MRGTIYPPTFPANLWCYDPDVVTKTRIFPRVYFTPEIIRDGLRLFRKVAKGAGPTKLRRKKQQVPQEWARYTVDVSDAETWTFEDEASFLSGYRNCKRGRANVSRGTASLTVDYFAGEHTFVQVDFPTRASVEECLDIFERHAAACRIPDPPPKPPPPVPEPQEPVIFIGHGHSRLWRDLKDHLHEQHGYAVEAYEVGARAGHQIRDILGSMMLKSSFGLLVMTGEDETKDGELRARQNVVHEAGLFQGRLGFDRAIVLLEDGTEDFSNLAGIQQIRFSRGNIKETYGDILATLRREFGDGRKVALPAPKKPA